MQEPKKIISTVLKLTVGLLSFAIIYYRLRNEFTPDKLQLLNASVFCLKGLLCFTVCLLLIPINWGIESYKWKLITNQVQAIRFKTALRSVYSGVCLGNLAPGRATEFVAKILFFEPQNRPKVTVLHFIGGMFQLSITIVAGLCALLFKLQQLQNYTWVLYLTIGIGAIILIALVLSIYKIEFLMQFITKKISKKSEVTDFNYAFTPALVLRLFLFSVLRFSVFFTQFLLLILMLETIELNLTIFSGVAIYFLITTTLPMLSIIEAAIRAAVALLVFKDSGISAPTLALSSVLLWLINIVIPSIFGYYFLLRQNFNFKSLSAKN